jgi:hypothetical protein
LTLDSERFALACALHAPWSQLQEIAMNPNDPRASARAFVESSRTLFPPVLEEQEEDRRSTRRRAAPPLDKKRAREACAPMGTLHSIVATVDAHNRRRTWYVIDPDPAVSKHYTALGLSLFPGCKVLVDAEAMRPVAVLDFDPGVTAAGSQPSPFGFNPYFDVPRS